MDFRTDSFSLDLENLLIPENINDLFAFSQKGSVPKQSIQVDWITQNEPLEQQQQQQHHQLAPLSEIGTASLDQISANINASVDIKTTATPQPQLLNNNNGSETVSTLKQPTCSSLSDDKSIKEKYHERREKNNMASRKSREKRKRKNDTVLMEIEELASSNESMKEKVKILEETLEKIKADLFASIVAKKTA